MTTGVEQQQWNKLSKWCYAVGIPTFLGASIFLANVARQDSLMASQHLPPCPERRVNCPVTLRLGEQVTLRSADLKEMVTVTHGADLRVVDFYTDADRKIQFRLELTNSAGTIVHGWAFEEALEGR